MQNNLVPSILSQPNGAGGTLPTGLNILQPGAEGAPEGVDFAALLQGQTLDSTAADGATAPAPGLTGLPGLPGLAEGVAANGRKTGADAISVEGAIDGALDGDATAAPKAAIQIEVGTIAPNHLVGTPSEIQPLAPEAAAAVAATTGATALAGVIATKSGPIALPEIDSDDADTPDLIQSAVGKTATVDDSAPTLEDQPWLPAQMRPVADRLTPVVGKTVLTGGDAQDPETAGPAQTLSASVLARQVLTTGHSPDTAQPGEVTPATTATTAAEGSTKAAVTPQVTSDAAQLQATTIDGAGLDVTSTAKAQINAPVIQADQAQTPKAAAAQLGGSTAQTPVMSAAAAGAAKSADPAAQTTDRAAGATQGPLMSAINASAKAQDQAAPRAAFLRGGDPVTQTEPTTSGDTAAIDDAAGPVQQLAQALNARMVQPQATPATDTAQANAAPLATAQHLAAQIKRDSAPTAAAGATTDAADVTDAAPQTLRAPITTPVTDAAKPTVSPQTVIAQAVPPQTVTTATQSPVAEAAVAAASVKDMVQAGAKPDPAPGAQQPNVVTANAGQQAQPGMQTGSQASAAAVTQATTQATTQSNAQAATPPAAPQTVTQTVAPQAVAQPADTAQSTAQSAAPEMRAAYDTTATADGLSPDLKTDLKAELKASTAAQMTQATPPAPQQAMMPGAEASSQTQAIQGLAQSNVTAQAEAAAPQSNAAQGAPMSRSLMMTDREWPSQLTAMIKEARDLTQGDIEIALQPERLGRMTIRMEMRDNNAVAVTIMTDNDASARLLNDNQARLADLMTKAGLDLTQHNASSGQQGREHAGLGGQAGGNGGQGQGQSQDDTLTAAQILGSDDGTGSTSADGNDGINILA